MNLYQYTAGPILVLTQRVRHFTWRSVHYTVFRKKTPTHIFLHISMSYLWI